MAVLDTIAFAVRRKDIRHERAHKKSEGQAGQGVSSGVKERILKDGKRDRRLRKKIGREIVSPEKKPEQGEIQTMGDGLMRRYVLRREQRTYHLVDPEKALYVDRHSNKVGIVIRYKEYSKSGGWRPERGLVPWDGEGGYRACREASVKEALRRAGMEELPDWLRKKIREPEFWGSTTFWLGLAREAKEAIDLEMVRLVMES